MPTIVKAKTTKVVGPHRVGRWLPQDPRTLEHWVRKVFHQAIVDPPPRSTAVASLENLVNSDPTLFMLFTEMLAEVPVDDPRFGRTPSGDPQPTTLTALWNAMDIALKTAPGWNHSAQIGTPINAILAWPMATVAGFAVFLRPDVNQCLQTILNAWGDWLKTNESTATLNADPGGWFSEEALTSTNLKSFKEMYVCDSSAPHWGYTSWDDFFTRRLREGYRPLPPPEFDGPNVIVNACESWTFAFQTNVKAIDTFWAKGQPYSLEHMLNFDDRVKQLAGGSVYQAFLSADDYHCWHAPVNGTIVDFQLIPGTYYSEPVIYSFHPDGDASGRDPPGDPDEGVDAASQGYISAVAARGLVWIQADNPDIGLMCMIFVGMAEVSTIDLSVWEGEPVAIKKGDLIGMFHFGGSTHCLVFGPQVNVMLVDDVKNHIPRCDKMAAVPVMSALAVVVPSSD